MGETSSRHAHTHAHMHTHARCGPIVGARTGRIKCGMSTPHPPIFLNISCGFAASHSPLFVSIGPGNDVDAGDEPPPTTRVDTGMAPCTIRWREQWSRERITTLLAALATHFGVTNDNKKEVVAELIFVVEGHGKGPWDDIVCYL